MIVTEPNITNPAAEPQPERQPKLPWAAWRGMWFFPAAVLWLELVLRISTIGFDYPKGLFYTLGFSLAAGLLLGAVTFYTGTLRWGILIHLCNNVVAWLTTYHPSPVTTVILPAVLLIWGAVAVLMLRRLPRRLPQPGNIRQGMTVPLALALLLLLGNALLYPVH